MKPAYRGGNCLEGGRLGQFAYSRGDLVKKRGGWYPNAHYVFQKISIISQGNARLKVQFV